MANISLHYEKLLAPALTRYRAAGRRIRRPADWPVWAAAALVAVLTLSPVLYLTVRALGAGPDAIALFLRWPTLLILVRSAALAGAVVFFAALIAVPLAWLTTQTDLPGRKIWSVLAALPLAVPSYVGAYLFVAALGPRGMLAQLLDVRLPSLYGFPGALIVLTLLCYPYIFLTVRASWKGIDPSSEEAARSLGLGPAAAFWRVTLPQLRPALAASGLLVALYVLRDFGAVSMLRYDTFTRVIYLQYKSSFDRSGAALLAFGLLAVTLVMAGLEMRSRSRAAYYQNANGGRQARIQPLGKWRIPALLFSGSVISLALVLPLAVLFYWLGRGLLAGEALHSLWAPSWNSFSISAMAAGLTLLAALPVSWLSARRPGRGSLWLERSAYAGYALPGIVIALALVYLGTKLPIPVYGTIWMLAFAYLILFLPQAIGSVRATMLQVHPNLEDASRGLGRTPGQTFVRVTLPLIQPGLLSGAALVFLTSIKELPATLLLSPFGFPTLATAVWSSVSEAYFARAAAPALLLVLVSLLPIAFMMNIGKK
jgi:iron(III) transport system permease protein